MSQDLLKEAYKIIDALLCGGVDDLDTVTRARKWQSQFVKQDTLSKRLPNLRKKLQAELIGTTKKKESDRDGK